MKKTIIDAIADPRLFGACEAFRGGLGSWRAWLTFLRAVYGLPMDADDLGLFERHTGRQTPRPGGYVEAVAVVGRQSGKSQIAAAICAYEALRSKSRGAYALLVAQDERGVKRTLFGYVREPFAASAVFSRELAKETADTLTLRSGVSLGCYPCRPAALRGVRAIVAIVDELAFFTTSDGSAVDREMLRSIRPTLATTGGKLLVLSSPYGQSGALWDLHRQHYGKEDSSTLVWQASAPEMHPTLASDYLQKMEQDDPEAYRSEVLGEFRAGVATLLDPEALEAVVVRGRRESQPISGVRYEAFADPSGGRSDAFTLAIGHRTNDEVGVVDAVRVWRPPFNPAGVVAEATLLLASYRLTQLTGDRYGGEWPREAFRSHGVRYELAQKPKSDLYLELLAAVNSGRVQLPDLPDLLRELRGLERRRGPSGRDRVDHRPGGHDDLANAIAGLVSMLTTERPVRAAWAFA
jgi:hypothetical protein